MYTFDAVLMIWDCLAQIYEYIIIFQSIPKFMKDGHPKMGFM